MSRPLGVGIIGAGPVTQAIHLPTLATLYDHFRVVHIMDVNSAVAEDLAARSGARSSHTDVQVLLDDPDVDVVAICSPHQSTPTRWRRPPGPASARLVREAAGDQRRGGTADRRRVGEVWDSVVVGAMHVHDPAVAAASLAWGDLSEDVSLVRVVAYLPSNDDLVALATELTVAPTPPAGPAPGAAPSGPPVWAAGVRGGILGLATHNLPLVRRFAPTVDEVLSAGYLNPWG